MQVIQEFVAKNITLKIVISEDKKNLYYMPTTGLNRFDLVEIFVHCDNKKIKLFDDIIQEALPPFLLCLKKLSKGQLNYGDIAQDGMGKLCNTALAHKISSEEINFLWKTLIWEFKQTSTYIYQIDQRYYLEIAPNYPWHFSDPDENQLYLPFDEFIKTYKPDAKIEIDQNTINAWILECEALIEHIK